MALEGSSISPGQPAENPAEVRDLGPAALARPDVSTEPLPSGWALLDAVLDGGLRAGHTAAVEGPAGSGATALLCAWTRQAAWRGEPVAVIDTLRTTLPHAWVEPDDARAPIWVALPMSPRDAWPAVDISLRSGAFGLVVVLDPPPPPTGTGTRLLRLARDRACRLILRPARGPPPLRPHVHITLSPGRLSWTLAPIGAAPSGRALQIRAGCAHAAPAPPVSVSLDDVCTDRLRPRPRAADRRPPHSRTRHAR